MPCQSDQMMAADNARVDFARSALVQRISALERRVTSTVDRAAESVNGVTDTVKSTVTTATDGLHKIRELAASDLLQAIDIRGTLRKSPWTSIGLAVAAGAITAAVVTKKGWLRSGFTAMASLGSHMAETGPGLGDLLKRELMAVGQSVIHDVSGLVKEQLHSLTERRANGEHYNRAREEEDLYCATSR